MHITLTPGARAMNLKKGRRFNSCLGVSIERETIDQVFKHMSPPEIAIYVVLLRYADVQGEQDTPTLSEIKEKHFPDWAEEVFETNLSLLKSVTVNDEPLVRIRDLEKIEAGARSEWEQ